MSNASFPNCGSDSRLAVATVIDYVFESLFTWEGHAVESPSEAGEAGKAGKAGEAGEAGKASD